MHRLIVPLMLAMICSLYLQGCAGIRVSASVERVDEARQESSVRDDSRPVYCRIFACKEDKGS